jgi:hypothetical protein
MTLTTFDLESASRIAGVVRAVESEPQRTKPLVFDAIGPSSKKKVFLICTFTAAWSIDQTQTVRIRNSTATLQAVNLFAGITSVSGTKNCAIAKDGTAWYLIAAQC